jgi:hypothetical protein
LFFNSKHFGLLVKYQGSIPDSWKGSVKGEVMTAKILLVEDKETIGTCYADGWSVRATW